MESTSKPASHHIIMHNYLCQRISDRFHNNNNQPGTILSVPYSYPTSGVIILIILPASENFDFLMMVAVHVQYCSSELQEFSQLAQRFCSRERNPIPTLKKHGKVSDAAVLNELLQPTFLSSTASLPSLQCRVSPRAVVALVGASWLRRSDLFWTRHHASCVNLSV
jgi:hypothetical protein